MIIIPEAYLREEKKSYFTRYNRREGLLSAERFSLRQSQDGYRITDETACQKPAGYSSRLKTKKKIKT